MKTLKELLYKVAINAVSGSTERLISGVTADSRNCGEGSLFVAIKGGLIDGHQFIDQVLEKGVVAVLCQHLPETLKEGINYIQTDNTRAALSRVASNWFDNPSASVKVVGITGTNGKTSVATLLYETVRLMGYDAGLVSTIKIRYGDQVFNATHTTPDPLVVQHHLAQMRDQGCSFCFMEVSSHGIDQERHLGIDFQGAVFTNLSHDHLDYHKTFAAYRDVKKRLFDQLEPRSFALANADDKNGRYMLQNSKASMHFYGLKSISEFKAQVVENQATGMLVRIEDKELYTPLHGAFNASNLLAVYAVCALLGFDKDEVTVAMSQLKPVEGRFNVVMGTDKVLAIVDFAHTPDALKNVYEAIAQLRTKNERLITVLGCGGDRDQTKRPEMGKIAAEQSDVVLFTSDNPRNEDPLRIIDHMNEGVSIDLKRKVLVQPDRLEALKMAVTLAQPNDILLVAGKGHEKYQEIGGQRFDFDDLKIVKELLNA